MNRITLCLAYYENPGMLDRQLRDLAGLPADMRAAIDLIVVDDGSPTAPALPVFENFMGPTHPIAREVRLYRMRDDIPWNMDACRNLAVSEASTPWVLLTDIDHRVPEKTWRKIQRSNLNPRAVYKFARVSEPDLAAYKQHPNTWLMTAELFDKAGGYDERFRGWYGTDGDFRNAIQKAGAPVMHLKEPIVRVPREVTPDASTTTLTRRSPENAEALDRIKAERATIKNWRPLRGLTPWDRVL
jgi:hypothetical protein